jgi:crotonobetainyl-CoA:carnitine CoA-transferase CaiB-like acyl-CoA transferase
MGRDDLASDASLAHNDGRAAKQSWLDGRSRRRRRHPLADVLAALESAAVQASKIHSIADIVADPHYAVRALRRRPVAGTCE